jgi:HSP90 family molecular chaperone
MQDSALVKKIGDVLTRRFLRFLADEARKDAAAYDEFFKEFGHFLKEGAVTDFERRGDVGKLLRFESSSRAEEGDLLSSFDDYISRLPADQESIYYLCAPNRELAESSPYYEVFKRNKTEVLFLYTPIDEFVMGNLAEYDGRKLVSAETGGIDLGKDGGRAGSDGSDADSKGDGADNDAEAGANSDRLTNDEANDFSEWLKTTLSESLQEVNASDRLVDSPAILVDHESAAIMRMMRMADQEHKTGGVQAFTPKQKMEINPGHPIIQHLNKTRNSDPELAKLVAEQLYDNATVAAGIMEDPRVMLKNLNAILLKSMDKE